MTPWRSSWWGLPVIRFRFALRPVEEIAPWTPGEPPHWFALTLGWYWIEVDGHELFRFADGERYADYQVARFWEDLIQLIRCALVPLPDDLAARVADPDVDIPPEAGYWWGWRNLSSGHMTLQDIWLWRVGDTMHLRWDGRPHAALWTAPERGEATMPVDDFIAMARAFDADFMAQMARRISSPKMQATHDYCAGLLENAIAFPWVPDWDAIRAALATFA